MCVNTNRNWLYSNGSSFEIPHRFSVYLYRDWPYAHFELLLVLIITGPHRLMALFLKSYIKGVHFSHKQHCALWEGKSGVEMKTGMSWSDAIFVLAVLCNLDFSLLQPMFKPFKLFSG